MNTEQVRLLLRQQIDKEDSAAAWATKHKMSRVYVSDVLAGRREPGDKILEALGLVKIVLYRRKK